MEAGGEVKNGEIDETEGPEMEVAPVPGLEEGEDGGDGPVLK
jgi:hypothetical protein